jgi:hypothetical protein
MKFGILLRLESLWVGVHYSSYNQRVCINFLPFVTLWVTSEIGTVPEQGLDLYRNDQ